MSCLTNTLTVVTCGLLLSHVDFAGVQQEKLPCGSSAVVGFSGWDIAHLLSSAKH